MFLRLERSHKSITLECFAFNDPSFSASSGCVIDSWPCTMDRLAHYDEFVDGKTSTISLVEVVV